MPPRANTSKQQGLDDKHWSTKTATGKPRVLLAIEPGQVGEALAKLLAPEFEVVGPVSDGRALIESALKCKPHAVVLDLSSPLLDGMDAGRRLKDLLPDSKIIALGAIANSDLASEVLRTWASGFLPRKLAEGELVKAVREVLTGHSYIPASLAPKMDESLAHRWLKNTKSLTVRQREVLQLLAEGCTMKEAAKVLGLTARTVAFHKYKIMQEFGIKNNSDLLRLAIHAHVVPPP
jgi:DNA-binding NarL/FixJ family response regulator